MRFSVLTAACGVGLSCVALAASAQQIPSPSQAQQALQQNPSLADSIRQRLQLSGLTPDQIRARLRAAGYPDSMLDAYLGPALPGEMTPMPGEMQLGAIQALGLGTQTLAMVSGGSLVLIALLTILFTGDLTRRKARLLFAVTYLMTFLSLAVPILLTVMGIAAWAGGEWILAAMSASGAVLTMGVGLVTLIRG